MLKIVKSLKVREFCNLIEAGIIKFPNTESPGLSAITEGKTWTEKGMTLRLDLPNAYDGQQKHIHVITSKGDYAWNQDGSISHKNSWSNKTPSKAVKQAAAKGLGIDVSMLENYMNYNLTIENIEDGLKLLLESVGIIS